MTYRSLDEVIEYITTRDRPLGFYVFTNDRARQDGLLYSTISGGVTINNCIIHIAQHDLPFGGIGASGMGQYHTPADRTASSTCCSSGSLEFVKPDRLAAQVEKEPSKRNLPTLGL